MAGYIGNTPVPQATQTRDDFVATEGQTTFGTSGYSPGYLDVYLNGIHLDPSDYTATNGSDVVLTVAANVGDVINVIAWTLFQATNVDFDNLTNTPTTLAGYGITDGELNTLQILGGTGDQGTLSWNSDDQTLNLNLGTASLQIGQEQYFFAKATEAISNGEVVMFAGAQGDHLLIAKADHDSVGFDPSYVVGVATQDFANNDFGYVTVFGKVRDLDTSAYSEGTVLYFDPDTAGGLTSTKPTPPDHIIQCAAVVRSHAEEGTLLVRLTHTVDTDEVPEGSTNLYYTDARVQSVIDTNSAGFATTSYVDTAESDAVSTANAYTDTAVSNVTTDLVGDTSPQLGGDLASNGNNIRFADGDKAFFGASNDLQIYHDGTNSYVQDAGTGNLRISGTNVNIMNGAATENYIVCTNNAGVDVKYDNATKLATTNVGVTVTGNISADGFRGNDNASIELGNIGDLKIFHDGSNSVIKEEGAGYLILRSNGPGVALQNASSQNVVLTGTSDVSLTYAGATKLATTSSGVNVTGTVSATSFSGDGSGLTGIESFTKSASDPTITSNGTLGDVWVNTTSGEVYVLTDATTNNNIWTNVGEGTGNVVPSYTVSADVLIVAGGGGGGGSSAGSSAGGGGGAGGYLYYTNKTLNSNTTYNITVGAGGTNSGLIGTDGSSSSVSGLSLPTAVGGGGGGRNQSSLSYGRNGGSGGGGGAVFSGGGTTYGGTGTSGQGNNGGTGYDSGDVSGQRGGGGGGASGTGQSAPSVNAGGVGGAGTSNSITGSAVIYAVGGSGGSWNSTNVAPAQTDGVAGSWHVGNNAHVSQGDGGGGGGGRNSANSGSQDNFGGNGGSGVVILRMPTSLYSGTTTGSPSVTTNGTDTILTYTSSGTYTA